MGQVHDLSFTRERKRKESHQRKYLRHYWKQRLCRVQNSLPSVKNRALGKDLLCRVLHSAKNCTRQRVLCRMPGTRQTKALDKGLLCRVPDSWQNLHTWHRLPAKRCSVTAFFAECLLLGTRQRFDFFLKKFCRVPQIWHSAKI